MTTRALFTAATCALLVTACATGESDEDAGRPPPGTDAGGRLDAGSTSDTDAGPGGGSDGGADDDAGASGGTLCAGDGDCEAGEYCDLTDVGCAGGRGRCMAQPTSCPDAEGFVCGCDGTVYDSACDANLADTSADPTSSCLDCSARDDFTISGSCPIPYGFYWDGTECVQVQQGCTCTGSDCDNFFNFQRCEAFAAACGG